MEDRPLPIYDKSTHELMHEFAKDKLKKGDNFSKQDAAAWFQQHYPKIKSNTVMMHVEGMSTNSTQRKHHPHIRAGLGWDIFYKLGPRQFRLWDAETDPQPIYKADIEAAEEGLDETTEIDDEPNDELGAGQKFAFEKDLQNFLVKNLGLLEPGLRLYEDEDRQFNGIEYPVGQRYIDILAIGNDDAYVVIELKVSRAYDRVVGQVLRYMAWVRNNLANDTRVRGIIVASELSDDLKLAASLVPDVKLVEYEISFTLRPIKAAPS